MTSCVTGVGERLRSGTQKAGTMRTRATILAATAALALVLSGCGEEGSSGTSASGGGATSTSGGGVCEAVPGDELVVACTSGSWSRLADPLPDGYVSSKGLQMTDTPPRC